MRFERPLQRQRGVLGRLVSRQARRARRAARVERVITRLRAAESAAGGGGAVGGLIASDGWPGLQGCGGGFKGRSVNGEPCSHHVCSGCRGRPETPSAAATLRATGMAWQAWSMLACRRAIRVAQPRLLRAPRRVRAANVDLLLARLRLHAGVSTMLKDTRSVLAGGPNVDQSLLHASVDLPVGPGFRLCASTGHRSPRR